MGKGHSWLLKKRIDSIYKARLINYNGGNYFLTKIGKHISNLSIFLKQLLNLGKGGE